MSFQEKLEAIIVKNHSLLCVGLDPVLEKLPKHIQKTDYPFFTFNKAIIDATHDLVCCYKPNSAFYEALGEKGIGELKKTCDYICKTYSEIPIILDAKRGDIGNTNNGYVQFAFYYLQTDAITLHPYLGKEALSPFLSQKEKGCIILCHTTNEGAEEIQDLKISEKPLYKIIAGKVIREWNENNNCLLVLGAKYPQQLAEVRKLSDTMIFLVPGIGAQGGEVATIIKTGLNSQKKGMIINSSRDIIFASSEEDFAEKAKEQAEKLREEINRYRTI